MTYAGGYTGSVGREEAFAFIRDQMMASRPSLSQSIFKVQKDITNAMRYRHHCVTINPFLKGMCQHKGATVSELHCILALGPIV